MVACGNLISLLSGMGFVILLIIESQALGMRLQGLFKIRLAHALERFLVSQALGLGVIAYSVFFIGIVAGIRYMHFLIIYVVALPIFLIPELTRILSGFTRLLSGPKAHLDTMKLPGLKAGGFHSSGANPAPSIPALPANKFLPRGGIPPRAKQMAGKGWVLGGGMKWGLLPKMAFTFFTFIQATKKKR